MSWPPGAETPALPKELYIAIGLCIARELSSIANDKQINVYIHYN